MIGILKLKTIRCKSYQDESTNWCSIRMNFNLKFIGKSSLSNNCFHSKDSVY